jgi:hypothetical protein
VAIDGAQIDRWARSAARTEDVEPRRTGDQRGADRWRPQRVAAGGRTPIPAVDDEPPSARAARSALNFAAQALMSSPLCEHASRQYQEAGLRSRSCLRFTARRGASLEVAQAAWVGLRRATN